MVGRDDVHRLVDAVPEARLPVEEQLLRSDLDGSARGAELAFPADVRAGLFTLLETASADLDRTAEVDVILHEVRDHAVA